jgi:hypothetical protein
MRILFAVMLLCAVGCGSDNNSTPDAGLPRCMNTPNQGGLCSASEFAPCINSALLLCSCQCDFLWICGLDIACDMGGPPPPPVRDMAAID